MAARSVHVILDRQILGNDALVLTDATLDGGIWTKEPPGFVGALSDWESESDGFLTGTEGRTTFIIPGEFPSTPRLKLDLHWNNPFVGRNSYEASVTPDGHAKSSGFSVGFYGDKRFDDNAEVTFVLLSGDCAVNEDNGEIICRNLGSPDWHHAVPSDKQVKVAAGTSPTSWYTTPENVQHIAYVGVDGLIHECFFRLGGTKGWEHNTPSEGEQPVAPGTSPTSWYTTPENVQHIAYVGTDQQIHECFFFLGAGSDHVWHHAVPSFNDTTVAVRTSPTSWYNVDVPRPGTLNRTVDVQHIAYIAADRAVHQRFFFIRGFGGWRHEIPSAFELPALPGVSPTSWYTTPDHIQHIAYVGTDQEIHECFFFARNREDQKWHHAVPGAGQVRVAPVTSPTSWFTTPENVQHIAYVGTDQQIHECLFFIR